MSTHEHEHDPLEPPVHDDYGPPEIRPEELDEQLTPGLNGAAAEEPGLDGGAEGVPEAVKARTARTTRGPVGRQVGRGVEWVRPTDLLARHSARVAGRGIHFQTVLSYRTRHGISVGARRVGDRAARLAPLSAFGHGRGQSVPGRSAVGMS